MAKKIFNDISAPSHSVRNIALRRKNKAEDRPSESPREPSRVRRARRTSSFGLWFIALLVIIFLFLIFSVAFSGTKVSIHPKNEVAFLDGVFDAYKSPQGQELGYEVMTIEAEGSQIVDATGEEYRESEASGMITVYNNYDEKDQRLIVNTRFETPNGLIYRIRESIVVPGRNTSDGEATPGSIDVRVYADDIGEEYNIGLVDFTIPGFKGDPRFNKFYAKSKTPMRGGFDGEVKTVSEDTKTRVFGEIESKLKEELRDQALAQKPDGFVLFPDAIQFSTQELPNVDVDENEVEIGQKVTLKAYIFDMGALASHIARTTLANYDGEPVEVLDVDALSFDLQDSSVGQDSIRFSLSGTGQIVWVYNESALKEDLLGINKKDIDFVLSEYPSIVSAEVTTRPFWKRSLPDNEDKIKIERVIEENN